MKPPVAALALLLSFQAAASPQSPPAGADGALPPTLLATRGKLLVSEDLAQPPADLSTSGGLTSLKHGWRFLPGRWEFVEGALRGQQVEADHHSAGAFFAYAYKDAILQFDLQLDGCRQALFCVDDPAGPRPATPTRTARESVEHICRVTFTKDGFATQKDDHDHDGPDQAVPFGSVKMPIKSGEWKTVVVELKGDEMVTTIDGHTIAGSHPLIAMDKAYFSFNVTGEAARFRRLRIWEALPNPQWAATKAKLPAPAATEQPRSK